MDLSLDSAKDKKNEDSGELSLDDDLEDSGAGIGGKMTGVNAENRGFIGNVQEKNNNTARKQEQQAVENVDLLGIGGDPQPAAPLQQ